jgi:hypothetical protein
VKLRLQLVEIFIEVHFVMFVWLFSLNRMSLGL